jgi:KipI family sensor histidine kinase inhibitor
VRPYGDAGLLVGVLGEDYESRWATTQALAAALREAPPVWWVDLVATYDHLFLTFDPELGDHEAVEELVRRLHEPLVAGAATSGHAAGRTFTVPVLFGGEAGPDLEDVAGELGTTTDALVDRLTEAPWRVRFVASPVGTPFTDRPTWAASVPRMQVPRVAVPAGSLGLSGSQAIIYPVRSPGGWRLVGRTPLRVLDPAADPLVPYRSGDWLRYVAVGADRFRELEAQGERVGDGPDDRLHDRPGGDS